MDFQLLKFVDFKDFQAWNVKKYLNNSQFSSAFPIVLLSNCLNEQSQKVKLFNFPEEEFEILGVDNKVGIFDAYIQKGKDINQPYKKMENGFLAYNPYRINVGSIGLKTEAHKHEYISPAYVVFSCKEILNPEFLFLVFKTNIFNQVIKDNTTGSVRQNLSFENLGNISIPLPNITTQKALVAAYQDKMAQAQVLENTFLSISYAGLIDIDLGIQQQIQNYPKSKLLFVQFKDISQWGIEQIFRSSSTLSNKFEFTTIQQLCQVGSGGTPNRNRKDYYLGSIPWIKTGEVLNDIILDTEEHITLEAIANSSAKLYPAGSLIIAMYGQGLTRGRTAKLGIDATTNQACAVLTNIDNSRILTDYLWVYLMNEYDRLRALASGNNQPNLNAGMIKNYPVILPDLDTQAQIVERFFQQKQAQKTALAQAKLLREQALREFEQAIFI